MKQIRFIAIVLIVSVGVSSNVCMAASVAHSAIIQSVPIPLAALGQTFLLAPAVGPDSNPQILRRSKRSPFFDGLLDVAPLFIKAYR